MPGQNDRKMLLWSKSSLGSGEPGLWENWATCCVSLALSPRGLFQKRLAQPDSSHPPCTYSMMTQGVSKPIPCLVEPTSAEFVWHRRELWTFKDYDNLHAPRQRLTWYIWSLSNLQRPISRWMEMALTSASLSKVATNHIWFTTPSRCPNSLRKQNSCQGETQYLATPSYRSWL